MLYVLSYDMFVNLRTQYINMFLLDSVEAGLQD